VLTIGENRAITLLAEGSGRRGGAAAAPQAPLRDLGPHPEDGEPLQILAGRFGPYVKHGKLNASLPKGGRPRS
jgi:DNA topoisomerase-1